MNEQFPLSNLWLENTSNLISNPAFVIFKRFQASLRPSSISFYLDLKLSKLVGKLNLDAPNDSIILFILFFRISWTPP